MMTHYCNRRDSEADVFSCGIFGVLNEPFGLGIMVDGCDLCGIGIQPNRSRRST